MPPFRDLLLDWLRFVVEVAWTVPTAMSITAGEHIFRNTRLAIVVASEDLTLPVERRPYQRRITLSESHLLSLEVRLFLEGKAESKPHTHLTLRHLRLQG